MNYRHIDVNDLSLVSQESLNVVLTGQRTTKLYYLQHCREFLRDHVLFGINFDLFGFNFYYSFINLGTIYDELRTSKIIYYYLIWYKIEMHFDQNQCYE